MSFFRSQVQLHGRNKFGCRYAIQDENFALSLYYSSPKSYKLCSKLFCLPSVAMLRLWLRKLQVKAGFVDNVFSMLEKRVANLPASERCCALLLDEVSLKRGPTYEKAVDEVNGFEDFGSGVRTEKYANQALVLMARGLQSPWKQPLAYFLACNTTPAETLKKLVTDAVRKLSAIGLLVVCVICDQGLQTNRCFVCLVSIRISLMLMLVGIQCTFCTTHLTC